MKCVPGKLELSQKKKYSVLKNNPGHFRDAKIYIIYIYIYIYTVSPRTADSPPPWVHAAKQIYILCGNISK
jgi:hypothetical protein